MNTISINNLLNLYDNPTEFKILILVILLISIVILNVFSKIYTPKYTTSKNTLSLPFSNEEIENIVTSVLESWNNSNIDEVIKNFYTDNLIKKQKKHITQNHIRDLTENIYEIKIDGLNKLSKNKNRIKINISFQAKYIRIYGENYNDYLGVSRFGSRAMLRNTPSQPVTKKIVQRWWFKLEDGELKADKFSPEIL
ncbi:hypothetical protein [Lactococcus lactis]|uniref:Uncharacterized protein n=1 Tax=Lactococcus lactis TaxID=1358 RepID=A0AAW5TS34_9LACT|nr:hypothetical protein [Lactococcus lactis]MCW2280946.1 hypothetical protein [Lactococcus lactis]